VYWLDTTRRPVVATSLAAVDGTASTQALFPNSVLLTVAPFQTRWLGKDGLPFAVSDFSPESSVVKGSFAQAGGRLLLLSEQGATDLQAFDLVPSVCTYRPCGLVAAREAPESPLALATVTSEQGEFLGASFVSTTGEATSVYEPAPHPLEACLDGRGASNDLYALEHTALALEKVYLAIGLSRSCPISDDSFQSWDRYDLVSFDVRARTATTRPLVPPSSESMPSYWTGAFEFSASGEYLAGLADGKVQRVTTSTAEWEELDAGGMALDWPVH
jgi:hypothetical protein